ncbi:uncharacterized protein G2W53_033209 [Senna tora]|uniref:Uncharacterized protein n=1 Tax=Senna tora TaxID=362788 RepID=A0A834SYU5_9FABA|nr:uncharacterized protein G2W53_033209 [Senna tora]
MALQESLQDSNLELSTQDKDAFSRSKKKFKPNEGKANPDEDESITIVEVPDQRLMVISPEAKSFEREDVAERCK